MASTRWSASQGSRQGPVSTGQLGAFWMLLLSCGLPTTLKSKILHSHHGSLWDLVPFHSVCLMCSNHSPFAISWRDRTHSRLRALACSTDRNKRGLVTLREGSLLKCTPPPAPARPASPDRSSKAVPQEELPVLALYPLSYFIFLQSIYYLTLHNFLKDFTPLLSASPTIKPWRQRLWFTHHCIQHLKTWVAWSRNSIICSINKMNTFIIMN